MKMEPVVMLSSPAIMRMVDDFPHPDGPISATNSPSLTSAEILPIEFPFSKILLVFSSVVGFESG